MKPFKSYFGERPGDDSGMRTAVWGPGGWIFLHSIAQNYPWRPTPEQKENYYNFFRLTGNVLPCRYCRESYQEYIDQKGSRLTMETMKNRKTLVTWLYRVHNKVNRKLGVKNGPTLREVWDKYESFRSVCHKTPRHIKKKGCTVPLNGVRKRCVINFVDEPEKNIIKKKMLFGKKKISQQNQNNEDAPHPEIEYTDSDVTDALEMLSVTDINNVNQIKRNYRRYALMYHPDRPTSDPWMFEQVKKAYDILMDYHKQRGTGFGRTKHVIYADIPGTLEYSAHVLGVTNPIDFNQINRRYNYYVRNVKRLKKRGEIGENGFATYMEIANKSRNTLIRHLTNDEEYMEQFLRVPQFGKKSTLFGRGEYLIDPIGANSVPQAAAGLGIPLDQARDINVIRRRYRQYIRDIKRAYYRRDRNQFNQLRDNAMRRRNTLLRNLRDSDMRRRVNNNNFGKKSTKRSIKLISIKRSTKSGKKLMATFETNGRKKIIHFGASGMSDLTRHKDVHKRRSKYIFRHHKDLGTGDPTRAGYLSMFILWNKPSLQASIADYRRRLNVYNKTGKFPTNISGYKSPGKNSKYQ